MSFCCNIFFLFTDIYMDLISELKVAFMSQFAVSGNGRLDIIISSLLITLGFLFLK